MSGTHTSSRTTRRTTTKRSGSGWKIVVLVVALLVVIAALGFLLWQVFGQQISGLQILDKLGISTGNETPEVAPGIVTQIGVEYSNGKNVAGNISVTKGTERPAAVTEDDDVVLLDIAWTGKKDPAEPLYITVSDPSFTDGDGLAVHHCGSDGEWDLIGTYTIKDKSVTFLADNLSPFAFQIISSNPQPAPVATAEPVVVTPEPTATPEPTPTPTPAPIKAVDYGMYYDVQSGAFALANELVDHQTYVIALVRDLPEDAMGAAPVEDEGDLEEADDASLTMVYVAAPETTEQTVDEPENETVAAPTASVLVNLDGTGLRTIDMPLVQAEDGTWCLAGPVTDGMLWTSNRDYYGNEFRFSLENNGSYLNLDDKDENVILNDNNVRTRWLVETATLADGSKVSTLSYRNNNRYYVSAMGPVAEYVTVDTVSADGQTPVSAPAYLGTSAPADGSIVREMFHFSVAGEQGEAIQLVLFMLDEEMTAPDGVITALENRIDIPALDETVNLSTVVVRDGDKILRLGVDYTINAYVQNGNVVAAFHFIGNYTGQIVRTYPGTTFLTNETPTPSPEPSPSPSPEPTATPAPTNPPPTGGGEGAGGETPNTPTAPPAPTEVPGNTGGDTPNTPPAPPASTEEPGNTPAPTDPPPGGSDDSPTDTTPEYDDPTDAG